MSLTFGAATSNKVSFPTNARLDDKHNFTCLLVLMPTTVTDGRNFWDKGAANQKSCFFSLTTVKIQVVCATTIATFTTTRTYLTNTWYISASTYNSAEKVIRHYNSILGTGAISLDAGTTVTGVGAESTDAGSGWSLGNDSGALSSFQGRIALFVHFIRPLSLGELQKVQYCIPFGYMKMFDLFPEIAAYCDFWVHLGKNQSMAATGLQQNESIFSGTVRGSSSVSGTTISADAPRRLYFVGQRFDDLDEAGIISVGGVTLFNRAKCGVGL